MRRAWVLVTVMWLMTGVYMWSVLVDPPSLHPSADAGHLVLLLMGWISVLVAAAFLRISVAPAEVSMTRRAIGVEAARERAGALRETSMYLLGLCPIFSLMALQMTGWAQGAAAMWVGSFLAMLLLSPDRESLERLAAGSG